MLTALLALAFAFPPQFSSVHAIVGPTPSTPAPLASPRERPDVQRLPPARPWANPYWSVPWVQPVQLAAVQAPPAPPPAPPRKTAWQSGPTKVENPGRYIRFEDLPSAFTPLEPATWQDDPVSDRGAARCSGSSPGCPEGDPGAR